MLRGLLGVWALQQWYDSGGGSTGEVQSPTFQGEKLTSFDRRRRRWCTIPFLEASFLKSLYFRCCPGGGCIAIARSGIL
jgi:hypothetical protein